MSKTALVTGALSNLGHAIAERLFEHGYHVYGTARKTEGKDFPFGRLLSLDITGNDMSSLDEIKSLDVLVNNAGVFTCGDQEELSDEDFDSVMDVNVKGLFHVVRWAIPRLKETDGSMVNISSMNALRPGFGTSHYDGSKGFVSSYTRSLAAETGLRVNAVAPGLISAERLIGSELERHYSQHAVKHAMMDKGEIADLVFFLAESRGIYGETILIDNGYSLK